MTFQDRQVRARTENAAGTANVMLLNKRCAGAQAFSTERHQTWIYALCDTDMLPRYVGKANDPTERLKSHLRDKSDCQKALWLRSLAACGSRPALVLLQAVAQDEWQQAEARWIARFRKRGICLLNMTAGGDGIHDPAPATRALISQKTQARWSDDTQRQAMLSGLRARERRLYGARHDAYIDELKAEYKRLEAELARIEGRLSGEESR